MPTLVRGHLLDMELNPFAWEPGEAVRSMGDGALLISDDGTIVGRGTFRQLREQHPDVPLRDHSQCVIVPGFVDAHLHMPQLDMMGAFGFQLLDWLSDYTFPFEARFHDPDLSRSVADAFYRILAQNGTTLSGVFASGQAVSARACTQAAASLGVRTVVGQVAMDQNVPETIQQTLDQILHDTHQLLAQPHDDGLVRPAIVPRFAPSCSAELLAKLGELAEAFPGAYIHTHVAENQAEVAWVRDLFPDSRSYVDVYAQTGLLRERTLLAHGIWLDELDWAVLSECGSTVVHCPTSNLFLGSGLFDLSTASEEGVLLALGSDIGAGNTASLFRVMDDAYKIQQLRGTSLHPYQAFWLATRGGALALDWGTVGSFDVGLAADYVVLDFAKHPLLSRRLEAMGDEPLQLVSGMMFLGDDRVVTHTAVNGKLVYES